MKKWIAMLLMACLCFSMMPAYAAEAVPENVLDLAEWGIYATLPEDVMKVMDEQHLMVNVNPVSVEDGAFALSFYIIRADAPQMDEKTDMEAWMMKNLLQCASLVVAPEAMDIASMMPVGKLEQLTKETGYRHYLVRFDMPEGLDTHTTEDWNILSKTMEKPMDIFKLTQPTTEGLESMKAIYGDGREIQVTSGMFNNMKAIDLEGNVVDSTLLAQAKLTMINVWATYCGPCLSEMPDLGQIAEEYKDKGLQIVGIVSDVVEGGNVDAEQRELAKKVVAETKANYVHILPIDEVLQGLMSQIIAVPTTLFLDAQGNQVGEIVFGSKTKTEWLQIIDEHLATIK